MAARSNMTAIVKMLHDKSSQLMDMLIQALSEGKLCVIDVSQMRGGQSLVLSGLIMRRVFDRNQQEFTAADPRTIPTIAVVEEAQSVLNENAPASEPYVTWVKEGRKYDLGAVLITQQPGSIPVEILSQGDNWFIFHLLSASDLVALKRAHAHFSDDLLSSLLNEPLPGQGVFWSSVKGKPYPISLRAQSFEKLFSMRDKEYNLPPGNTYARVLHDTFDGVGQIESVDRLRTIGGDAAPLEEHGESIDIMARLEARAIERLRSDNATKSKIQSKEGLPWGALLEVLKNGLPQQLDDRDRLAYELVPKTLNQIFASKGKSGNRISTLPGALPGLGSKARPWL